ncbi:Dynein heavy chain 12, axonemal [Bulinus truncatus]|nr:Dynein heavy chain 12, axonemal [Bulinus truncatus]
MESKETLLKMSGSPNGLGTLGSPRSTRGTRPDGFPVLPPIHKPEKRTEDPYAHSKLLTFRLADHQKNLLIKILQEDAIKAAKDEKLYFKHHKDDPKPEEPQMPAEMMSKDRRTQLNYRFLKSCVETGHVEPMQQSWSDRVLELIPEELKHGKILSQLLHELLEEVKTLFESSMKKSMG